MSTSASGPSRSGPLPNDGGWVSVFVRRPIFAMVLNLLVIIAGIAAVQSIEIRELPDVDRPVVTVRSSYPGASPESMDAQVTAIIESAVSRVEGVTSISSNSSYGSRPGSPAPEGRPALPHPPPAARPASPSSSRPTRICRRLQWTCVTPLQAS